MLTINKSLCTLSESGSRLVVEASTAGLKPGEWPDFIAVVNDQADGRYLFCKSRPDMHDGELAGYIYQSKSGADLLVIND